MGLASAISVCLAHFSWPYVLRSQAWSNILSAPPFQLSRAGLSLMPRDHFLWPCSLHPSDSHSVGFSVLSLCISPFGVRGGCTSSHPHTMSRVSSTGNLPPSESQKRSYGTDAHTGRFTPRELESAVESLSDLKTS